MPELTPGQDYMADLAEIKRLDVTAWNPAGPEDLHSMTLSELSELAVQAEELEPHGRP